MIEPHPSCIHDDPRPDFEGGAADPVAEVSARDSIVLPEKEIAAGYLPVMPSFKNRLTEEEIFQLTAYIKSLATPEGQRTAGVRMPPTRTLSPEEYRARVGFIPSNIKSLSGGAAAPVGPHRPSGGKK